MQLVPTTENFDWSQHPEEGTPKGGSTHKRELISNKENMDPHTKVLPQEEIMKHTNREHKAGRCTAGTKIVSEKKAASLHTQPQGIFPRTQEGTKGGIKTFKSHVYIR